MICSSRLSLLGVSIALTALVITSCTKGSSSSQDLQVIAKHGAWTWFNDERALYINSHLYVGYVDTAGYTSVAVFSMETKDVIQNYRLGSFREKDDHNNPAFISLENETVLATYAPHHTQPYWYWRFGEPVEPDSIRWSQEQKTKQLDANTTYSNLFQLSGENGRIYNFYRGPNFDPAFMTSDDQGRTWSTEQHFITSGGQWTRPYVKYISDGTDRIDMLFTQAHPRDTETNIYHAYYEQGNLYQSDGTLIQSLPGEDVAPMPVNSGTRVYDAGKNGRAWVWDLEYNSDGNPVAAFVTATDSTTGNDLRYHYARWDETESTWVEQEIAYAGTHLYDGENHYAGGITLDPGDPTIVYTSSDVHPETGTPSQHYQIYRGTSINNGSTWSWSVLTPAAAEDNIRPFIPRGEQDRLSLLWLRGRYTSYKNYDTDVVGLLE